MQSMPSSDPLQCMRIPSKSGRWCAIGYLFGFVLAFLCSTARADDDAAKREFFESKIRPILAKHCYECHSTGSKPIEGGLQLDFRDGLLKGGESGPGLVPNFPDQSRLLEALRYDTLQMPPTGKLPDEVIRDFEQWIATGAVDPRDDPPSPTDATEEAWKANLAERSRWWSLQPPAPSEPPAIEDPVWQREPVDRFIGAATAASGLTHAPRASPEVLLRRLSIVLTGLPPSPDEVLDFQQRWADEPDRAYHDLVDRLLESPHFGERFARHWMDVMHYTDTYGYEWDIAAKGSWEYRDYLIRAFNSDVGFDQLIREQIAGDLLPQPRLNKRHGINESLIGPMFFHFGERRHGSSIDFAGVHQEMADSQIDAFSKSFLAMTVACARCHDHKLDAISQRDYYALAGVFMTPRWTSRSIDTPDKYAHSIEQLRHLRSEIQTRLGAAWLEQLRKSPIDLMDLARKSQRDSSFDELGYPLTVLFRDSDKVPMSDIHAVAEQGATRLILEEDGLTVRAEGDPVPATDSYTVDFRTSGATITELQLHALPHPSLGQNGPGRTPHGNFVLSHIQIEVQSLGESIWREVAVQSAHADYEQPGYPVAAAITADAGGWGIGLGGNVALTARFVFAQPISLPEGGLWRVRLQFQLGSGHSLGRFRLAMGSDTVSTPLDPPTIAARWHQLVSQWQQERERRREHNRAFTVLTDFSSSELPEDWVADGAGVANGWVAEGTPRIALEGDAIVADLLPRGIHTHALSPKLAGAIRLPEPERFPKTFVSTRLAGGTWAGVRHIPQNAFLNEGPFFFDPAAGFAWTPFTKSSMRYGVTRILSEISTPDLNANFPPRIGVARMGATTLPNDDNGYNKPGWFSLTRVVAHDAPGKPLDDLEVYAPLFAESSTASNNSINLHIFEWYKQAIERWKLGTAVPGDARLIQGLIDRRILGNRLEAYPEIAELVARYRAIESTIDYPRSVNSMDERGVQAIDYRLNVRGDVHQEGPAVPRNFLEVFAGGHSVGQSASSGRLELANYLSSPENPKTARVYVNRVWQWIFGTGIVDTPSDFGKLGGRPSHPELLDWLALQFMQEGWSTKQLIRRLVLSETFRQSGQGSPRANEVDPGNRLLHHYPTRRLEAEAIRDGILAASGRLDRSLYGRPIRPFRGAVDVQKRLYSGPMDGDGRRSIYLEMSVMQPPEFLVGFNLPDLKLPAGRRDVTNVPAQALLLMNSRFVTEISQKWGESLIHDSSADPGERIERMFLTALGRAPTREERQRWLAAAQEFSDSQEPIMTDRAVWSRLAHALFNTKEFLYYR
jgi:hypothetical protein